MNYKIEKDVVSDVHGRISAKNLEWEVDDEESLKVGVGESVIPLVNFDIFVFNPILHIF